MSIARDPNNPLDRDLTPEELEAMGKHHGGLVKVDPSLTIEQRLRAAELWRWGVEHRQSALLDLLRPLIAPHPAFIEGDLFRDLTHEVLGAADAPAFSDAIEPSCLDEREAVASVQARQRYVCPECRGQEREGKPCILCGGAGFVTDGAAVR